MLIFTVIYSLFSDFFFDFTIHRLFKLARVRFIVFGMGTKKKSSSKKSVKSTKYSKAKISKSFSSPQKGKNPDYSSIEKEAIERSNRTISTIENFLAKWDSTKQKPQSMNPEVTRVKRFYDSLILWQKSALKAQKSKFDEVACKKRLASFVHICQNYS